MNQCKKQNKHRYPSYKLDIGWHDRAEPTAHTSSKQNIGHLDAQVADTHEHNDYQQMGILSKNHVQTYFPTCLDIETESYLLWLNTQYSLL